MTTLQVFKQADAESKPNVFAVLEVLATRSQAARSAILNLADANDPLASVKVNRMMRRALYPGDVGAIR